MRPVLPVYLCGIFHSEGSGKLPGRFEAGSRQLRVRPRGAGEGSRLLKEVRRRDDVGGDGGDEGGDRRGCLLVDSPRQGGTRRLLSHRHKVPERSPQQWERVSGRCQAGSRRQVCEESTAMGEGQARRQAGSGQARRQGGSRRRAAMGEGQREVPIRLQETARSQSRRQAGSRRQV